jgi:hypothetical protein
MFERTVFRASEHRLKAADCMATDWAPASSIVPKYNLKIAAFDLYNSRSKLPCISFGTLSKVFAIASSTVIWDDMTSFQKSLK